MFDMDEMLKFLERFNKCDDYERERIIVRVFKDDEFKKFMFMSKKDPKLIQQIDDFYSRIIHPKVLKGITNVIWDVGPKTFDRTIATLLFSICNVAIDNNNKRSEEVSKLRKEGRISTSEQANVADKIDRYNHIIAKLLEMIKKIVKKSAKKTSRTTGLPLELVITLYHSVPSPEYIDKYKVGFYLNPLMTTIYSNIDTVEDYRYYNLYDVRDIKWRTLFKDLFGVEMLPEVASILLLEGANRLNKYSNESLVKDAWNDITEFALKELENSPDGIRTQMIELYIKRIEKMFSNQTFNLRVNLLSILDIYRNQYPLLSKTIERYKDRLIEIIEK